MNAQEGYVKRLALGKQEVQNADDLTDTADAEKSLLSNSSRRLAESDEEKDESRRQGDLSLYTFYFRSLGWWRTFLTLGLTAGYTFGVSFPQVWLRWWTAADGKNVDMYLAVYALFAIMGQSCLCIVIWFFLLKAVPRSGERLHRMLLDTVIRAPLSFFVSTDTGITTNRFSQDMSLIDFAVSLCIVFL